MMPMDFEWVLPCILAGSICRFSHAIGVILTFPQTQQQDDLLWRKFAWSLPQSKMWFGLILVFFRPRQTFSQFDEILTQWFLFFLTDIIHYWVFGCPSAYWYYISIRRLCQSPIQYAVCVFCRISWQTLQLHFCTLWKDLFHIDGKRVQTRD